MCESGVSEIEGREIDRLINTPFISEIPTVEGKNYPLRNV